VIAADGDAGQRHRAEVGQAAADEGVVAEEHDVVLTSRPRFSVLVRAMPVSTAPLALALTR
jgi:hypothetical protein